MRLLVSISIERFSEFRRIQALRGSTIPGQVGGTEPPPDWLVASVGGRVVRLDWENRAIEAELPLPSPRALCWEDPEGPLRVALGFEDEILHLDPGTGAVVERWSHPCYNDMHTLIPGARGRWWTTCAGTDAVHELGADGAPTWSWWGPLHGWDRTPLGEARTLDPGADHRKVRYATLKQALHPNAAIPDGDGALALLFHQGLLARIGRDGRVEPIRDGLDHPHGLTRLDPTWTREAGLSASAELMLCDTGRGLVRFLTARGEDVRVLTVGSAWLQDARPGPNGQIFALDVPRFQKEGPPIGANRIVQIDVRSGAQVASLAMPIEWRPFQIMVLDEIRAARCGPWSSRGALLRSTEIDTAT